MPDIREHLEINEIGTTVFLGKTRFLGCPVFGQAPMQVVGNTNIKSMPIIGFQEIDIIMMHIVQNIC